MSYEKDKEEWEETYEMLQNQDVVLSELSNGKFVSLKQQIFNEMVEEINYYRIKYKDPTKGVELILVEDAKDSEIINKDTDE